MTELTGNQKAALNYNSHIALTANAGSGKTFVLSRRYIEIAYNENISLRNIAAITFTEKASGELYKKITNEVNKRLEEAESVKEKARLEKIRRQLVSANISTIHSFCIDILREFPMESQLDANFIPIEKNTSDELIQLSIEEIIKSSLSGSAGEDNIKYLIRLFASRKIFSEVIFSLIEKRKSFLRLTEELYSRSEDEIASFFYSAFCSRVSAIIRRNLSEALKCIRAVNDAVLNTNPKCLIAVETASLLSKINPDDYFETLLHNLLQLKEKIIIKSGTIRKQGYLKDQEREMVSGPADAVEEYFQDFSCLTIPEDHLLLERELAVFGKILSDVFLKVLNLYTEKKKLNGYLDFEDILLKTRDVLKIETVSRRLSEKYKYIMVDEYQDTNEIQFEILMPILNHLRNGNLFVVGDEKQSIYMFRDAELEIFERTKQDIAVTSGSDSLITLPDSFRMAPSVCLFTNYVFRNLFKDPVPEFNEVQYSDIVCANPEAGEGGIEFLLSDREKEQEEAELTALKIMELTGSGKAAYNEIAILCRKRRSFTELEKILNKYNLPFTVLGGKGFFQQQIIYDIYNYLSFLLNNNNDTALAGVLRSPFFSVSDAELFEISLRYGNTFWEKFYKYSLENPGAAGIYKLLKENSLLARALSFSDLVRKLLNESWFISVIASRKTAVQDLANIDKLISIAVSFSNQKFKTLYDFVSYLETAINTQEDEGHAVIASEENTVKIMTIHQAKGLEFKCVFLYNSHDTSQNDTARAKDISLDKELGFLTALPHQGNFFEAYRNAPVVNLYNYIIKRKNLAEVKRLLYVAVTRAKNYLFISASHKDFSFKKDSFMSLLMKGLSITGFGEFINIRDKLKFLTYSEEKGYENPEEIIELRIPVITDLQKPEPVSAAPSVSPVLADYDINIDEINDAEEEEIVSATKIAVFNQCPVKYQLTYEFGYLNLFKQYKGMLPDYEFTSPEDDEFALTDIKGTLVHALLEKEYPLEKISEAAELLIRKSVTETPDAGSIVKFRDTIVNELTAYYNSQLYSEIKSYTNYRNELGLYCRNNDYNLYGVIDKLIIHDNSAFIVDYKTDAVTDDIIEARVKNYLPQLKFYAFLVTRHYPAVERFKLQLVFIRLPERKVYFEFTAEEIKKYGDEISRIVNDIRTRSFRKNLSHCHYCYYAINNKCVK